MWTRFRDIFADTPILFFAVVIGVALTFRVAVGAIREASTPPVVAPTFVTTAPEPGLASAASASTSTPSSEGAGSAPVAEVGAAAKVQPIGSPARLSPKPRGHGRRPTH